MSIFRTCRGLLRFTEAGVSMYCPEKYTRYIAIPVSKITQVEKVNKFISISVNGISKYRFNYDSEKEAFDAFEELIEAISEKPASLAPTSTTGPAPEQLR